MQTGFAARQARIISRASSPRSRSQAAVSDRSAHGNALRVQICTPGLIAFGSSSVPGRTYTSVGLVTGSVWVRTRQSLQKC